MQVLIKIVRLLPLIQAAPKPSPIRGGLRGVRRIAVLMRRTDHGDVSLGEKCCVKTKRERSRLGDANQIYRWQTAQ